MNWWQSIKFWLICRKVLWQSRVALFNLSRMSPARLAPLITKWRWETSRLPDSQFKEDMLGKIQEFESAVQQHKPRKEIERLIQEIDQLR